HRTGAHTSIVSLLFVCLESWLPRFGYSIMTGLPIENNDVSRLVAHNYLKHVDHNFEHENCVYLRFVDDTVIFAESELDAVELKRRHHLALRQIGLNPNAAKSSILEVSEFERKRHRHINERIDWIIENKRGDEFQVLAQEWMEKANAVDVEEWEPVMRRVYSAGRRLRSPVLRASVSQHICDYPTLAEHALAYLGRFDVERPEAQQLLDVVKKA